MNPNPFDRLVKIAVEQAETLSRDDTTGRGKPCFEVYATKSDESIRTRYRWRLRCGYNRLVAAVSPNDFISPYVAFASIRRVYEALTNDAAVPVVFMDVEAKVITTRTLTRKK